MADHPATEIMDALMRNLREILRTESIIGQPIVAGKMTILPVIKVSVGFGAGGGGGMPETGSRAAGNGAKGMMGSGGGGGGGLTITPVGFLVVEEGRAMMITPNSARWDWMVESIPEMWEKLSRVRQENKDRKAARSAKTEAAGGEFSTPTSSGMGH